MGGPHLSRFRLPLAVVASVVALDQLTKAWAVANLEGNTIVIIEGFLELRLTRNTGAAFSSFQGLGPVLAVLGVAVVGWIVLMLRKDPKPLETWALALVLGGAVGNLIDRLTRGDGLLDGAVIDWIDLWWIPTFNVADSAITIGAALLILAALRGEASR